MIRLLYVGGAPLRARLATSDSARRRGLMHVQELPEDEGMLFMFPARLQLSFCMKNTLIPLSLAFLRDDGVIDQILDMSPHDPSSYRSRSSVRYALEVNQGWFQRHGVGVGAAVTTV